MPNANKIDAERVKKVWLRRKTELDITQEQAAIELNITQSALSQYLNGFIPLNTTFLLDLAKLIKVEPAELSPKLSNIRLNAVPFPVTRAWTSSFAGVNLNLEKTKLCDFAVFVDIDVDDLIKKNSLIGLSKDTKTYKSTPFGFVEDVNGTLHHLYKLPKVKKDRVFYAITGLFIV